MAQHARPSRRLIVLGSTGSIGVNTLAVVDHLRALNLFEFEVVGLAAGANAALLADQAMRQRTNHLAIADESQASGLSAFRHVHAGPDSALKLVRDIAQPGDLVLGAMVGSAGIPAILEAIDRGCDIALANKETLVAAGSLVMPKVRQRGVQLLPVDSEHSAVFQCLEEHAIGAQSLRTDRHASIDTTSVRRIVLTASGGPFRTWPKSRINQATVEQALNHPTWNMGPKVTIDSASLMNKALEIIEAHWLFDMPSEKIEVIIHPQSIVHSFVEYVDGSIIAQLGPPDMRTPIQYALTWPLRLEGCSRRMDWANVRNMEFEPVDHERFAALRLAYRVIESGGTAGAVFNAANEAAVAEFLARRIPFGQIPTLVQQALDAIEPTPVRTLDDVHKADRAARRFVEDAVESGASMRQNVETPT